MTSADDGCRPVRQGAPADRDRRRAAASAAGDVLVRVRAALTCGTDVKVFRRGYHARMIVPPALFGHELAGDIVAMGKRSARISSGPARGGGQFGALRRVFFLPARPGKSVRGSAVQQRRVRRIHPHSGAHRRKEHVRSSGACELSGRGAGGAAGLRAARSGRDRSAAGRYRRGDRPGAHRHDVRAPGQGGLRRARDRHRPAAAAARPRRANGRG